MAKNQVIVSITANAKGLQSALGEGESALSKFGKAAGVVAAAAAVAVGAIGVKAVKSASELEQAMGGMGAVFKDSAGQMEQWANAAAGSLGLAKSEYASLATIIGSQLKNMGVSTDQLAGQTDGLIRVGADLAAQFGGSTSDAVSALSSLLRGERDPIERYGVSINEAAVKAKMAEMGLSGLSGEAEKNAKLQATLALLSQQTADAMGAFSREATTLAGAQQRLSAGAENLYATFGTALLPAATAVTAALGQLVNTVSNSAGFQAFTAGVTSASNAFADFVFNILNGTGSLNFGSMFTGLLDAAVSGIQNAANWLASGGASVLVNSLVSGREALFSAAFKVFPAILDALVAAIPAIIQGLVSLVTMLAISLQYSAPVILNGAVQLFTGLITALVQILPSVLSALVGLLPVLVTAILGMVPAILQAAIQLFTAIVESLPVIIPMVITALVELLPKLIETVLNMIPAILDAAVQLFTSLAESLPIILPLIITAIINLIPKLVTTILGMIPRILQAAIDLFTGIVTAVPKILPELIPALINLLPAIIGAIIGMVPELIKAGVNLIQGLIQGIGKMAGAVGEALINIAEGAVKGFLSFLGIKSPSRLFRGFGLNVGQGLAIGIDKSGAVVTKALDGLSGLVNDGFSASLATPDMTFSATATGAGVAAVAPVYNVTVNTLNPTAETGRVIVQSIRDYERGGGRL